jgi:hypothetical protein
MFLLMNDKKIKYRIFEYIGKFAAVVCFVHPCCHLLGATYWKYIMGQLPVACGGFGSGTSETRFGILTATRYILIVGDVAV